MDGNNIKFSEYEKLRYLLFYGCKMCIMYLTHSVISCKMSGVKKRNNYFFNHTLESRTADLSLLSPLIISRYLVAWSSVYLSVETGGEREIDLFTEVGNKHCPLCEFAPTYIRVFVTRARRNRNDENSAAIRGTRAFPKDWLTFQFANAFMDSTRARVSIHYSRIAWAQLRAAAISH